MSTDATSETNDTTPAEPTLTERLATILALRSTLAGRALVTKAAKNAATAAADAASAAESAEAALGSELATEKAEFVSALQSF